MTICLFNNGCLKSFDARGHSYQAKKGYDIVCASVTTLLRTAAKILHADESLKTEGDATSPGSMSFSLREISETKICWVRGITDFLLGGLLDLQQNNPDHLRIDIKEESERRNNDGA